MKTRKVFVLEREKKHDDVTLFEKKFQKTVG